MNKEELKQRIQHSRTRRIQKELNRQLQGVDKKINDLLNLEARERLQVEKTLQPLEIKIQLQELETQRNTIIQKIRESPGYKKPIFDYINKIGEYF